MQIVRFPRSFMSAWPLAHIEFQAGPHAWFVRRPIFTRLPKAQEFKIGARGTHVD